MSGQALVATVFTRPLEGSDNIQLGTCAGYQVIVGKDVENGALGIFFDSEIQLSEEFCEQNNLVRKKDPITGQNIGGYLEANRRVRAIKMRGAKSDGLWMPLSALGYTGGAILLEGDQFQSLNGHEICQKYVTPATRARQQQGHHKQHRSETLMFKRHVDTEQLVRYVNQIPSGALIYVTEKLHGTSHRVANVIEPSPPKGWKEKLVHWITKWLAPDVDPNWTEWVVLNGTRNVILEKRGEGASDYYGNDSFRLNCTRNLSLNKGETLYGEIVGYTESGAPIMSPQEVRDIQGLDLKKRFASQMVYSYGQKPGECQFYIYRITQTNEDGQTVELSWSQVQGRCRELGLPPVPQLDRFFYGGDPTFLLERVNQFVNADTTVLRSIVDGSHIREGIVLRYESEHGCGFLKQKSWVFGVLEGYLKENPEVVDREEVS